MELNYVNGLLTDAGLTYSNINEHRVHDQIETSNEQMEKCMQHTIRALQKNQDSDRKLWKTMLTFIIILGFLHLLSIAIMLTLSVHQINHLKEVRQTLNSQNTSLQNYIERQTTYIKVFAEFGEMFVCCPEGWIMFIYKCYYVSKTTETWQNSRNLCKAAGADLVIIDFNEEQDFLEQYTVNQSSYWIGLTDIEVEGQWCWVDRPFSNCSSVKGIDHWAKGEPSKAGGENCAAMKYASWYDRHCTQMNYRICEKKASLCSIKG
ncbi:CD209 antigen-like protein C [Protopterus annectens]|uniref:CD209 antigen-like protein C n=1 Tax=Protopterus annectens TaxID=7888 RepID=UPI001CFB19F1|nr:CD209 antigen-like protein C [Protopterus annectens]